MDNLIIVILLNYHLYSQNVKLLQHPLFQIQLNKTCFCYVKCALVNLAEELHADVIPKKWRKYNVANISATEWIDDFKKRIDQLTKLSNSTDYGKKGLWFHYHKSIFQIIQSTLKPEELYQYQQFGGLLFPEAYLTAIRQSVAQENKWSLEELELKFELNPSDEYIQKNNLGFIVDSNQWKNHQVSYEVNSHALFKCFSSNGISREKFGMIKSKIGITQKQSLNRAIRTNKTLNNFLRVYNALHVNQSKKSFKKSFEQEI